MFLIIFLIPFKIKIYYEFTNGSKYKITFIYLFGIIKKEIDSTNKYIDKDNANKYSDLKLNYINVIQHFINKGKIEKLRFIVNIGFSDASLLGISIGIIWAMVNSMFIYLLNDYDIEKIYSKDIQVNPIFNQDFFELFFLCIIKVNLVYIIIEYIKILKIRKGGESVARTSNRRINENHND